MSLDVWTWWDGTTINVGVWIGARVDFVIDVMTDALARVFAGSMSSVVPDVGVDVLADASVNVVSGVMTELECTRSASLEACLLSCCTAFAC